ncbi:MAG: wax ester/triacylglycerol synthase domain-containing protein [Candidatus Accumulibacter propinquus]
MTQRERISHVDTAWLRMDRPENLMQILGVMIFEGRIDAERFKRTVAQRMLRYRRFRQIAREDADGTWWIDDPDFDIDAHVRHSSLPAPHGTHELQKFVAEMASSPFNPARPRWEFNLVDTARRKFGTGRSHPPRDCGRHRTAWGHPLADRCRRQRPRAWRPGGRVGGTG